MALRPSKITSEFLQSCNKFFSSSADGPLKSMIPTAYSSQNDQVKARPSFRYKIANTGKPEGLPELNFQEETAPLFSELQPSAISEFKFDFYPPKWAEKPTDNSPFPASIKPKPRIHVTYSDQQKAEDKLMKHKMAFFNPTTRSFSSVCVRGYSRGPAENSGSGSCKKKVNACYKTKAKKTCKMQQDCPKFKIMDCEQSKGSNCKLNYLDPNCSKKFAPYPSYSESCAENLPDDPSECHQCPWRTCDGPDRIEPGKPVRHKRNYSTSCSRHLDATAGVVVGPLVTLSAAEVQYHLCKGKCGQSKPPCKQPPGPCEVRKQHEDQKRREKEIHVPPKPKKASEDSNRMVLTSVVGEGCQDLLPNPYTLESLRLNLDEPSVENKSSWLDIAEGEEMILKKKKHPNCHKTKKPKRPPDSNIDQDLSIEYGNVDWWSGRGKSTVVIGNRDPSDTRDCNMNKCQEMTIKSKQEVTKKTWKKKAKCKDKVDNKTTPFQIRRG